LHFIFTLLTYLYIASRLFSRRAAAFRRAARPAAAFLGFFTQN